MLVYCKIAQAHFIQQVILFFKNTYPCLKGILLDKSGSLTDEHVDAAQYLIGENEPGIGGLNSTNYHDVHWVTSSSKKIVVYESLSTGLNVSLVWVIHYKHKISLS